MKEDKLFLRKKLREIIRGMIREISTTSGAGGYLTPKAFAKDEKSKLAFDKHMAKLIGGTLAENMYYEYRNDTSKLPHQKIGEAISEINKQMVQIERVLRMNARLKKEYGVSNERLWERTRRQMMKLEGRLTNLAGRLREMRG